MRHFTIVCFSIMLSLECLGQAPASNTYQCLPCGQSCDQEKYSKAGKCPHCNMDLVIVSSISFKTIEPSKVCAYVKAHPKAVLLDVRTPEEFKGLTEPRFGTLKN